MIWRATKNILSGVSRKGLVNMFISALIGALIGSLISWAIAHYYYSKSLNDLKIEAQEKKRIDELIFRGIENIGTIKYTRDESGMVIGVDIELKGDAANNVYATGDLSKDTSDSGN